MLPAFPILCTENLPAHAGVILLKESKNYDEIQPTRTRGGDP
ncbi:hypothetical protein HMPREF1863_01103, partial [Aedoeadaptatus coxii]